jgi:hypothetical protein
MTDKTFPVSVYRPITPDGLKFQVEWAIRLEPGPLPAVVHLSGYTAAIFSSQSGWQGRRHQLVGEGKPAAVALLG